MTTKCERCGAMNRDNVSTCIECGAPLVAPKQAVEQVVYQKHCINCNRLMNANLNQCPFCGANQSMQPYSAAAATYQVTGTHSKIVAALLAIFLGGLGAHKFYLGQGGQGVLYLLFCWTFIPSIVGFIEGIMYLGMSDTAFNQKYP